VSTETRQPILQAKGLVKRYGHVTAIDGADFELYPGEILAVIGDNGAGKSSMIKALSGATIPDSGEIFLDGKPAKFRSPLDARSAGIETVYQDLAVARRWTSRPTSSSAASSAAKDRSAASCGSSTRPTRPAIILRRVPAASWTVVDPARIKVPTSSETTEEIASADRVTVSTEARRQCGRSEGLEQAVEANLSPGNRPLDHDADFFSGLVENEHSPKPAGGAHLVRLDSPPGIDCSAAERRFRQEGEVSACASARRPERVRWLRVETPASVEGQQRRRAPAAGGSADRRRWWRALPRASTTWRRSAIGSSETSLARR
jgi:energy-coupling factor transporter ATP-binding protein EcfA2